MLTLRIVPYSEIENLSSLGRIKKLLTLTKEGKIVLLQGRLKKEEETELIKTTMEEINSEFRGIELAVIYPKTTGVWFKNIRNNILNKMLGSRLGLTVIGPSSVVKKIKQDPSKIELYATEPKKRKKRRRRK